MEFRRQIYTLDSSTKEAKPEAFELILPRGSEYPSSKVVGPQIHALIGFWTLKPYYLDPLDPEAYNSTRT